MNQECFPHNFGEQKSEPFYVRCLTTQGDAYMNNSNLPEIRRIKEEVESQLLKLPGVNGVDIGPKIVGGRETGQMVIRVYVTKKHDVPEAEAIPKEIQGIPTDVIERRYELH
jgi:hypothetical protein